MMLLLSLLGLGLTSRVLASDCHHGDLHHCTCVNVTQPLLSCPPATRELFVYQSLMSESSEVMSLHCQPGVSRNVLEDIELSGVAGQTVSVKMVGCETESALHGNQTHTEMIRLCTPVRQVSFLSRFLNFFSLFYLSLFFLPSLSLSSLIPFKFTGPCPWMVVSRGRRN